MIYEDGDYWVLMTKPATPLAASTIWWLYQTDNRDIAIKKARRFEKKYSEYTIRVMQDVYNSEITGND